MVDLVISVFITSLLPPSCDCAKGPGFDPQAPQNWVKFLDQSNRMVSEAHRTHTIQDSRLEHVVCTF